MTSSALEMAKKSKKSTKSEQIQRTSERTQFFLINKSRLRSKLCGRFLLFLPSPFLTLLFLLPIAESFSADCVIICLPYGQ